MRAMERLLYPPQVYGDGIIDCREYIVTDDVVTQGGTVNAVRKHIHRSGGSVVAVVALAYSIGSTLLKPTQETITLLKYKHGEEELISFMVEYRISDSLNDMTQSQLRYLLRFKSIYTIRRRAIYSNLYRNAG